jgi:hypothetical protein
VLVPVSPLQVLLAAAAAAAALHGSLASVTPRRASLASPTLVQQRTGRCTGRLELGVEVASH